MLTVDLLFQIGYVSLEDLVFLHMAHISGCTARTQTKIPKDVFSIPIAVV